MPEKKGYCNHEIYCTNEKYISNDKIEITMECSICQTKFKGILKKDE